MEAAAPLRETGLNPSVKSSQRRVVYRASGWRVHEFNALSGDTLIRVCVLRMAGSLVVWVGGARAALSALALAVPPALATPLLGAEAEAAAALARRLSTRLHKPVYVASGEGIDRFALPLLERTLLQQIKTHPEFF